MKTLFPKNLYQKWDEMLAGATDVLLATHVNPTETRWVLSPAWDPG
jgi:hypothetical protein